MEITLGEDHDYTCYLCDKTYTRKEPFMHHMRMYSTCRDYHLELKRNAQQQPPVDQIQVGGAPPSPQFSIGSYASLSLGPLAGSTDDHHVGRRPLSFSDDIQEDEAGSSSSGGCPAQRHHPNESSSFGPNNDSFSAHNFRAWNSCRIIFCAVRDRSVPNQNNK